MKKPLIVLIITLIMFSSCVTNTYLLSEDGGPNELIMKDGNQYQKASTESIEVKAAGLDSREDLNAVAVNIHNISQTSYDFYDSQIKIFGGNKDKNKWEYITTWDSQKFLEQRMANARTAKNTVGVLGFISVIDVLFNENTDLDDLLFTMYLADEIHQSVSDETSDAIREAKNSMLFSNTLSSGESKEGLIFFPTDRTYPDYKVEVSDGKQKLSFIFYRDDREEILHPWTCDRKRTLFAITTSMGLDLQRFGFDFLWLSPKGVGMYDGCYFTQEEETSFPFGLTVKAGSNVWVLLGCELGSKLSEDELSIVAPQLGLNFSYNWVDLIFKASYNTVDQQFMFDAGLGVSF